MKFKNSQLNSNDAAAAAEYTNRRGLTETSTNLRVSLFILSLENAGNTKGYFSSMYVSLRFSSWNMRTFLRTLEHFLEH